MAQAINPQTTGRVLPGIVTDQPEIFESLPTPPAEDSSLDKDSDGTNIQQYDENLDLNEIPVKDAFSFFATREQQIAQFFTQRFGEYKIRGTTQDEETDVEKYHRLVKEVTELVDKFKSRRTEKLDEFDNKRVDCMDTASVLQNLDELSKQLKFLEMAAHNGTLSQPDFTDIQEKLGDIEKDESQNGLANIIITTSDSGSSKDDSANLLRISALERKINQLEKLLGYSKEREQAILETTHAESLYQAVGMMSSWLEIFSSGRGIDKIKKDLEYLIHKAEALLQLQSSPQTLSLSESDPKFDSIEMSTLDKLCSMVTSTEQQRALVPNLIHKLNALETLHEKTSQIVNNQEQITIVQDSIEKSLKHNEDCLKNQKETFARNIDIMKEFIADVDSRINDIRTANLDNI